MAILTAAIFWQIAETPVSVVKAITPKDKVSMPNLDGEKAKQYL